MSVILASETDTYDTLWGSVPQYATNSPGEQYASVFHDLVQDAGATVLDVGCGAGKGMLALKALGYHVGGVDITLTGLTKEAREMPTFVASAWHDLSPIPYLLSISDEAFTSSNTVDYVYCCDMLEHVPAQFTMLAVARMMAIAKKGVFLSVWFAPDVYGPWVGRPLHLTTQPYTWWRDSLAEIATILDARDCQDLGVFYVRGK